jgi:hypothetical protein
VANVAGVVAATPATNVADADVVVVMMPLCLCAISVGVLLLLEAPFF